MVRSPSNLFQLLEHAARTSPDSGITIYAQGSGGQKANRITYRELYHEALSRSISIKSARGVQRDSIVLLHFDDHADSIVWLWAVVAADLTPAISTPLSNDMKLRHKHIRHLNQLLLNPIIITRDHLKSQFGGLEDLDIVTVEELASSVPVGKFTVHGDGSTKQAADIAVLMLTSGSTGNAKAVPLKQGQVLAAIRSKARFHGSKRSDRFLNWIGLDHVANLTEVHLHAMGVGAEQFHVHAPDFLANAILFATLVDRHRISYSFAPNFFLASLKRSLETYTPLAWEETLDLSCLRHLNSGGEANTTDLCDALTRVMGRYGAPANFISPGFGMTETCAGSIHATQCPQYDLSRGWEFASLGPAMPGMSMRISRDDGSLACANEIGNLEISGDMVLTEYFNNPEATAASFTQDGWFITGDRAFIDENSILSLAGRKKEVIVINGLKLLPQDVEAIIDSADICGISPSYLAAFPTRPAGADTESLCIVYLPSYGNHDVESRVATRDAIRRLVMNNFMLAPYKIIPLTQDLLQKSSLGKLSRAKIRIAFESGVYAECQKLDDLHLAAWRSKRLAQPANASEKVLLDTFSEIFNVAVEEIGANTSFFDLGASSVEVLRLKSALQKRLSLPQSIPVITFMTNSTAQSLARALLGETIRAYDPVVILKAEGRKTPLWFIHPGFGEVLIFLNLAKHINDRPIYALRAKGFEGEGYFVNIDEMVATYCDAIKRQQPVGPYALAGYSLGGTLAFEIAKVLRSSGAEVNFVAMIDQNPHVKELMHKGDWVDTLLTLCSFLEFVTEETKTEVSMTMREMSRDEILDFILSRVTPAQLEQHGLNKSKLANWASLAHNLYEIAEDYEPSGHVNVIDVFWTETLAGGKGTRNGWREKSLGKWENFCEDVKYCEVGGNHYDLISPQNVGHFAKKFQQAMAGRGL